MEDMTKYIGKEVEVWDNGDKVKRILVAILPSDFPYGYVTSRMIGGSDTQNWKHCQPKELKWYENSENYGKAIKARDTIMDAWMITALNENSAKTWRFYEPLEEPDWKMI